VTEEAIQEARGKIVQALNLTPLVPPQSDVETDNVVNEAWAGLHDLVLAARRVAKLEAALREISEAQFVGEASNIARAALDEGGAPADSVEARVILSERDETFDVKNIPTGDGGGAPDRDLEREPSDGFVGDGGGA
jgi:hypothetical protein